MRVIESSFLQFVYPFAFEARCFNAVADRVNSLSWPSLDGEARPWEPLAFPREDLLANVGEFLNPKGGQQLPATAFLWQLRRNEALESFKGFGAKARWSLRVSESGSVPFVWCTVQLALFRHGLGFVMLEVRPETEDPERWLDFLHHFRFAGGGRGRILEAQRKRGRDQWEPYWPPMAIPGKEGERTKLRELLDGLLLGPLGESKSSTDSGWKEVFVSDQLIPHAALLIENAADMAEEDDLLFVYRVRNAFHSAQTRHPAREELSPRQKALLAYAHRAWFTFSLDGGGFVAFDPPTTDFFRRELSSHLRQQYYLLFLLAHYQRFALMRMTQVVAEGWVCGSYSQRAKSFGELYDDLLDFEARGYFIQTMQREHHHRCFRKWLETLQVPQLHAELSTQIERMHQTVTAEQNETLQSTVGILGAVVALPAVVFGFLGINLPGITADAGIPLGWAFMSGAFSVAVGAVLLLLITHWTPRLRYRRRYRSRHRR